MISDTTGQPERLTEDQMQRFRARLNDEYPKGFTWSEITRMMTTIESTRAELAETRRVVAEAVAAMRESYNNPEMYTAMDAALHGRTLWVGAEKRNAIRVHDALLALIATASTEQEAP
jgi:hypothetical protein